MTDKPTWRLLDSGANDGFTNMAIDEAMLLAVQQGRVPPTLRLYAWQPACLSIGTFQSVAQDIDVAACAALGIDWVRRPTGGRAILHDREITYSVAAHQDDERVAGDVMESYRRISLGLLAGLRLLGVQADLAVGAANLHPPSQGEGRDDGAPGGHTGPPLRVGERAAAISPSHREGRDEGAPGGHAGSPLRPGDKPAACFAAPSQHEIMVGGRKIIGSAQRRQGSVLLQHGSLLLDLDVDKLLSLLRFPTPEMRLGMAARVRAESVTLRELLGQQVTYGTVLRALTTGFATALDIELVPGSLTAWEEVEAARLRREKYTASEWQHRK